MIGITETHISEKSMPLINIGFNGYTYKGVGTKSCVGKCQICARSPFCVDDILRAEFAIDK